MTDQEFQVECGRAMDDLYKALGRAADHHDFEPDMNQGALTISFDDPPARFVVSPQSPVQQVWVSANSRSFKFAWNGTAFVLPDTGQTLKAMLAEAISARVGAAVALS